MSVRAYMSPDGGLEQRIVDGITEHGWEVYGLLNMYQSGPIHEALLAKLADSGIVGLIFDRRIQFLEQPYIEELIAAGAYIGIDKHEKQIHSQYLVLQSNLLFTGTYLWTYTSEHRYADILIESDTYDVWNDCYNDWFFHWDHCEQFVPE